MDSSGSFNPNFNNLAPSKHSLRDLKFYIWVLSHSKYPRRKISLYEHGNGLREIDECATLASNDSLYDTSGDEGHMESVVTFFQTDQQINEKVMRTGKVLSQIGGILEEDETELNESSGIDLDAKGNLGIEKSLEIQKIKKNNLNRKIGGDLSFDSDDNEVYFSEKDKVNNPHFFNNKNKLQGDKKKGKGILTMESEKNFKYSETLLEKQYKRLKRPSPKAFNKKVHENLLNFHKDTPNTKEFSGIKLNFGMDRPLPTLEEDKTAHLTKESEEIIKTKIIPMSRTIRETREIPDRPIEEIPKPYLEYGSMPQRNNFFAQSRKYRTDTKSKPKRRISRSRSRKLLPPTLDKNREDKKKKKKKPDLTNFDFELINSLKKTKNNKMQKSTLNQINYEEDLFYGTNEKNKKNNNSQIHTNNSHLEHNANNQRCRCKMCLNSKHKPPRRRSSKRRRTSFDSQKSVEEIQEDKLNFRRKNSLSRIKRSRKPSYDDPYRRRNRNDFDNDGVLGNHMNIFGGDFGSKVMKQDEVKTRRDNKGWMQRMKTDIGLGLHNKGFGGNNGYGLG
jgi:hypothetical protein